MEKRDGGYSAKHTDEHGDDCRELHNKDKKEREPLLVIPGAEIRDTRKPKFCIETGVVYRKCVVLEASGQFTVKGGDSHGEDQKVFQR